MNSFFSVYFNLVKSTIGAALLFYPAYFSTYGLLPTLTLTLLGATLSTIGLLQFILLNRLRGPASMGTLTKNNLIKYFISGVVISKTFIVVSSYFKILNSLIGNKKYTIGYGLGLSIFVMLKKMDHLKFSSTIGLIATSYLILLSIYNFIMVEHTGELKMIDGNILMKLPFIVFAFTCHQTIFTIHNEHFKKPFRFFVGVIVLSMGTVAAIYSLFGILNSILFEFNGDLNRSLLDCLNKGILNRIARYSYVLLISFSIPLQLIPCRKYIYLLMGEGEESLIYRVVCALLLIGGTLMVGLSNIEISQLQTIVGSTSSTAMCFFIPSILSYILIKRKSINILGGIFANFCMGIAVVTVFILKYI